MIRGHLPLILAIVMIALLTLVEGFAMKDRWGSPDVEAEELGKLFDKVPKQIGAWTGQDMPVDELVKKTAGAVAYVQRRYVHNTTNQAVVLWLIVGHSRDIVRHTPNVCYPASGFRQEGSILRQPFDLPDGSTAEFFTAKFDKEDAFSHQKERVFWAWNHPDIKKWESPKDSFMIDGPRFHYGLKRALYKVYFSSAVTADESTTDDNAAAEFAQLMLPAIDAALFSDGTPTETLLGDTVLPGDTLLPSDALPSDSVVPADVPAAIEEPAAIDETEETPAAEEPPVAEEAPAAAEEAPATEEAPAAETETAG